MTPRVPMLLGSWGCRGDLGGLCGPALPAQQSDSCSLAGLLAGIPGESCLQGAMSGHVCTSPVRATSIPCLASSAMEAC